MTARSVLYVPEDPWFENTNYQDLPKILVAGLLGISRQWNCLRLFSLCFVLWLGFRSCCGMLAVVNTAPLVKHRHDRHSEYR